MLNRTLRLSTIIFLITFLSEIAFIRPQTAKPSSKQSPKQSSPKSPSSGNKKVNKFMFDKPQCREQRLIDLDRLAHRTLGIVTNNRILPTTEKELIPWCRQALDTTGEFEKFARECFVPEVRDFGLLGIYSLKQTIKRYCNKRKSKATRELLGIAPCLNKYVLRQMPCIKRFMNSTAAVRDVTDNKMKIPHICCQLQHALTCADEFMEKIDCVRDKRNVLIDLVKTGTGSVTELACGEYNDNSDKCANLGRLVASPAKDHKYRSILMMLVELLDSMDEFKLLGS